MSGSSVATTIRKARENDLDAIADLQARSIMTLGIEAYGRETCEAWAKVGWQMRHTMLAGGTFFVAERDDALVGVAGWTTDSREPDCAWPRYVFVSPTHARLGVGRKLMVEVERSVTAAGRSRLTLWASLNAVPFYQALGYRSVKEGRWPISGGIEMASLLMSKNLLGKERLIKGSD